MWFLRSVLREEGESQSGEAASAKRRERRKDEADRTISIRAIASGGD